MLVKQSLEKYLATAYYLIDETLPQKERIHGRYASFRRLIVSYESNTTLRPQHRIDSQRMSRVQFLPELIYDVISERKYFLGIDFQTLRGIRHVNK